MAFIRIAIASDLHVGEAARSKELQVAGAEKNSPVDPKQFLDRFREFFAGNVSADFLIVPGDITNTGSPAEFDLAATIVEDIAKTLAVPVKNIIVIPGNHDVDWSVVPGATPHPLRLGQRYDPFRAFVAKLQPEAKALTEEPYFHIQRGDGLYVAAYNSAWHDQPKTPAAHHGRAEASHMAALRAKISAAPPQDNEIRIFLVHHHPVQYMDFLQTWDDFSIMQNAEAIQDLLNDFKFDFLIHGHKHYPNFNTQSLNGGLPVAILCAGSFCRTLDTRWNGIVANQFHVITADSRDQSTGCLCGTVKSWAYLASAGWDTSYHTGEAERIRRRGTGIEHEKPFGFYCLPEQLVDLIRQAVEVTLGSKSFISLPEIFAIEPRLKYVPAESLERGLRTFGAGSSYNYISSGNGRYLVKV